VQTTMKRVKPPDTCVHPRVITFYSPEDMLRLSVLFSNGRQWFEAGVVEQVTGSKEEDFLCFETVPLQMDRNITITKCCIVDIYGTRYFTPLTFDTHIVCACGQFFKVNLRMEGLYSEDYRGKSKDS
jgi:hypothetical protein